LPTTFGTKHTPNTTSTQLVENRNDVLRGQASNSASPSLQTDFVLPCQDSKILRKELLSPWVAKVILMEMKCRQKIDQLVMMEDVAYDAPHGAHAIPLESLGILEMGPGAVPGLNGSRFFDTFGH